jgi:hypothetical protein
MNILHPRIVVLIPNIDIINNALKNDGFLSKLKIFNFRERYDDFIRSKKLFDQEYSFLVDFLIENSVNRENDTIITNFDSDLIEQIMRQLKKQTPSVRFLIVVSTQC